MGCPIGGSHRGAGSACEPRWPAPTRRCRAPGGAHFPEVCPLSGDTHREPWREPGMLGLPRRPTKPVRAPFPGKSRTHVEPFATARDPPWAHIARRPRAVSPPRAISAAPIAAPRPVRTFGQPGAAVRTAPVRTFGQAQSPENRARPVRTGSGAGPSRASPGSVASPSRRRPRRSRRAPWSSRRGPG